MLENVRAFAPVPIPTHKDAARSMDRLNVRHEEEPEGRDAARDAHGDDHLEVAHRPCKALAGDAAPEYLCAARRGGAQWLVGAPHPPTRGCRKVCSAQRAAYLQRRAVRRPVCVWSSDGRGGYMAADDGSRAADDAPHSGGRSRARSAGTCCSGAPRPPRTRPSRRPTVGPAGRGATRGSGRRTSAHSRGCCAGCRRACPRVAARPPRLAAGSTCRATV
eukprot:2770347-Prymnesium_polylepis.1